MPDRLPNQVNHVSADATGHPTALGHEARPAAYGRGRRMLKAVGYGLLFAVPVTLLAFVVRQKFLPVIELDEAAITAATDVTRDNDALFRFLVIWQEMTQPKWPYIAATILCIVIWRRHQLKTRAIWAFVTMMVAWNLQLVLKVVVHRARPHVSDPVSHAPGYSFPSGHAANAAAIATIVTLLVWPVLSPRARRITVAVAVAYPLITAADRVFLGVHFPSDVVAGLLFGSGLGVASYLGYLGWNPTQHHAPPPPEGTAGPEPHELNPRPPVESDDDER
ncbi:phosphatase PAP2 family protein [Intrasporangium calvum]|uniref:Phosphatase PAP2 family protein n=1 Tax=Intrasporangium calvum TaxID=53358 RepID=A0ABT5GET7_9MICO|nr:phosphatase PAP2 family protein [Intrasporangium calvum]MDC5696617.1 phosphatase PAP2 family protein [Intrasporangium calvum]